MPLCCLCSSCICAVLNTLRMANNVLTSKECRRVWLRGDLWSDWLVRTVVLKPPGMIQQALDLLEEHQGEWWYGSIATPIRGVFWCGVSEGNRPASPEGVWHLCVGVTGPFLSLHPCSVCTLCRLSVCLQHQALYPTYTCSSYLYGLY